MNGRTATWPVLLGGVVGLPLLVLAGVALAGMGPLGIAALAGLVVSPVAAFQPFIGLLAVAATFPFAAALMVGGATATKALALLVAIGWVVNKVVRGDPWSSVFRANVLIFSGLFFALVLASIYWAKYPAEMQTQILRLGMLLALTVLTVDLVRSWERVAWLAKALVLGGIVAAVLTVVQYFTGTMHRAGDDVAGGVNATALILVSLVPFAFFLIRSPGLARWRIVGLAYLGLTIVAVSVTFSRMSYLLLPLLLLAESWGTLRARRGRLWLAVFSVVGVITFVSFVPLEAIRERVQTIVPYIEWTFGGRGEYIRGHDLPKSYGAPVTSSRGYHVLVALAMFRDHPFLGVGYFNYRRHFLDYQRFVPGSSQGWKTPRSPHGTYYGVLAELGLVGMALWLALLGVAFRNVRTAWTRLRSWRGSPQFLAVQAVALSFAVQLVYGFYDDVHSDKLFWLLLGLTVVVRQLARTEVEANRAYGWEPDRGVAIAHSSMPPGARR